MLSFKLTATTSFHIVRYAIKCCLTKKNDDQMPDEFHILEKLTITKHLTRILEHHADHQLQLTDSTASQTSILNATKS